MPLPLGYRGIVSRHLSVHWSSWNGDEITATSSHRQLDICYKFTCSLGRRVGRLATASGRVRLRCGVLLGRRVREASEHRDQRTVVEDGEPFARVEPGASVFERLSVIELRRRDCGLDINVPAPPARRLGEEGFVRGPPGC